MKYYVHSKNDQNSQKILIAESRYNRWDDVYDFSTSSLSTVQVVEDEQKLDCPSSCKPTNVIIFCSCDGLVLILVSSLELYDSSTRLPEEILLWNLSTRESILLPYPEYRMLYCVCGLGYDATSEDYKILAINLNAGSSFDTSIEFLSLKSGSWRRIGYPTGIKRVSGFEDCGMDYLAFLHGAFHWFGRLQFGYYTTVLFNISNEVYGEVPLLEQMYYACPYYYYIDRDVSVLRGMLCFYSMYNYWKEDMDCTFKLWVIKDYGVRKSWTNFIKIQDNNLFHLARSKYMFADCEVLVHCKCFACICSTFTASRGPFGLYDPQFDVLPLSKEMFMQRA